MSKLLSQAEIDALHAAVSASASLAGDDSDLATAHNAYQTSYETHAFVRPKQLEATERRSLEERCEGSAGRLRDTLISLLRLGVRVEVGDVDSVLMRESLFIDEPSGPMVAQFVFSNHASRLSVELSSSLGFAAVERLLGGAGEVKRSDRRLTAIEFAVLKRFVTRLTEVILRGWSPATASLRPVHHRFHVGPKRPEGVSPSETLVSVAWHIDLPSASGLLKLYIPRALLPTFLEEETAEGAVECLADQGEEGSSCSSTTTFAEGSSQAIDAAIRLAEVPLKVVVGEAEVQVQELVELQIGDLIQLDTKSSEPLTVKVGPRRVYSAYPVERDGRVAIEIVDASREEGSPR